MKWCSYTKDGTICCECAMRKEKKIKPIHKFFDTNFNSKKHYIWHTCCGNHTGINVCTADPKCEPISA